ncbi:ArsR family transcriptional regulator [Rhizobiaceae bacterium n13]|uniref:ArsR family transcriptional regulator n=1 Tax=Ferirhizobium litorale TaxID=2927786 RepID=A0AAE3QFQ4_9HYPH|nr:helix-turn-helix transcriptional regulator [Fererhizobium litorale]MDI7863705.1 ArsR family transcriptional regulator [Fererhizobium litorale]MDI7924196.1 ArsR family transcriptional regulator [Fererhizobium litorale]
MDKKTVLAALAALGQDTRLEAFRLLVQAGADGVPAGEIASRLGAVQNTMSAHLRVLDQAGLVRAARDGRIVRYTADMAGFRDLLAYLTEDCCGGRPEICAPALELAACRAPVGEEA